MTARDSELYGPSDRGAPAAPTIASRVPVLLRWLVDFSACDWLVLLYLSNLNLTAFLAHNDPARTQSLMALGGLLAFFMVSLVLARGFKVPIWGAFCHRAALICAGSGSYLAFHQFLPLVNPNAYDHQLYQLDLALFRFEPAMFFDRFVSPTTTEWFAFFYFGYFILLSSYIFPLLFVAKDEKLLTHFTLSMLIVVCVGQTIYMLVPGFGPAVAFPELFHNKLEGGTWWKLVEYTVTNGGAHKDIFPSLHTGLPLVVWLFTFSRRKDIPYRYVWPPLGFVVLNIIIATMFLRWHYVIDVVAGAALAFAAHFIGMRVAEWEPRRREGLGLGPTWPQF
jgi:hypothetical protein